MSESSASSSPPGRRILVVDDDADVLKAIGNVLSHHGHTPVLCRSGVDALGLVRAEPFDLLLVDYRMPELTGIDLLAVLNEEDLHLPAIIMTGYAATHDRLAFERLRIVAVLKKPILGAQLLHAIESHAVSGAHPLGPR